MERSEIEDIANRVAQTTVALARAENRLDLSEFKSEIYERFDARLSAYEEMLHKRLDSGIAGMSHEAHAVEHIRFRAFLESAGQMRNDFIKQVVAIIAAAIVSFLLTVYFAKEGTIPVTVPKSIGSYSIDKADDRPQIV